MSTIRQLHLGKVAGGVLFTVTTFLVLLALITDTHHRHELRKRDADAAFWAKIVSPSTARALATDHSIQQNYFNAVTLTASMAKRLAEQFHGVPELQHASATIEQYRRSLPSPPKHHNQRRQDPLTSLGNLLGLGGGAAVPGNGTGTTDPLSGIGDALSGSISSALSGLGNSLLQDANGAGMFLGVGLGAGAAQGLNIAPAAMTKQVADQVIANSGMQATGLNPAIQNAATGASASLLGSVNTSSLLSGATGSLDLRSLALGLATGIGNGTSAGLKLSPAAMALEPPAGNSTGEIAGTFGFGLTKSLFANVDTSKALGSFDLSQFTGGQPVSAVALSLASGLGGGAVSGLKLTQANLQAPVGSSTADALGAFGFGLSNSVTSNVNASAIMDQLKSNTQDIGNKINFAQTAAAFGTGLGSGAAAGLKLSGGNLIVGAPDPNGQDLPAVAGNFAFGLTKSVTENINMSSASPSALSGLTSNLDIGRIAQGAAMGLVQGAGDAVNSMGGLQALINGTAKMPTTPLPAGNMAFNDSVGGAASGFGQGLGGQGTLTGVQLLSQINVTSLVDGLVNGNGVGVVNSGAPSPAAMPSNGTGVVVRRSKRSESLPAEVLRRQADVGAINTDNSFNLSVIINAATISSLGQRVIDALTCEGIGGLVLVGLGLFSSGAIGSGGNINTTLIKQVLPHGVIHFTNAGNLYQIDGALIANNIDKSLIATADGVLINGNTAIKFGVFLALHIILALLVFILLIPLVISMEATRNLLVRLKLFHILPKIPRWMDILWVWVMAPLALLALVFGSLTAGTSAHFRTAHGVLGLLTIFTTLGASALHFYNKRRHIISFNECHVFPIPTNSTARMHLKTLLLHPITLRTTSHQSLLLLLFPSVIAGFGDLSAVSLCVTRVAPLEFAVGLGLGLGFLYVVASALTSLTLWLGMRELRRARKGADIYGEKGLDERHEAEKRQGRKTDRQMRETITVMRRD